MNGWNLTDLKVVKHITPPLPLIIFLFILFDSFITWTFHILNLNQGLVNLAFVQQIYCLDCFSSGSLVIFSR